MRNILERIKALNVLEIPKAKHSLEHVQFVFGPIAGETQQGWLVSCSHCFNAPAPTARIQQAEKELGIPIPSAYRHLLGITDGAKLFCVAMGSTNSNQGTCGWRLHGLVTLNVQSILRARKEVGRLS